MQAILNLSTSKYFKKKIAGQSIFEHCVINLMKFGVIKLIIIGKSDSKHIKSIQKKYSDLIDVNIVGNFTAASNSSIMDTFFILNDAVFFNNFLFNKKEIKNEVNQNDISKFQNTDVFYIKYDVFKKISSIQQLLDKKPDIIKNNSYIKSIQKPIDVFQCKFKIISSAEIIKTNFITNIINKPLLIFLTMLFNKFHVIKPLYYAVFSMVFIIFSSTIFWLKHSFTNILLFYAFTYSAFLLLKTSEKTAHIIKFYDKRFINFFNFISELILLNITINSVLLFGIYSNSNNIFKILSFVLILILVMGKIFEIIFRSKIQSFIELRYSSFLVSIKHNTSNFINTFFTFFKIDFIVFLILIFSFFRCFETILFIFFGLIIVFFISLVFEFVKFKINEVRIYKEYRKSKVIVFDFDGTILPTMERFADIAGELINKYYGISFNIARRKYIDTSGVPFFKQLDIIVPGGLKNVECADEFEKTKLKGFFEEKFSKDVIDTIKIIRENNIATCVSSGNFQYLIEKFVEKEDIKFDYILGFEEGFAKGEEHFNFILKKTNISKDALLFVGDSIRDGELAEDFNIKFIGRTGIFSKKDFEKKFKNIFIINKISELCKILKLDKG